MMTDDGSEVEKCFMVVCGDEKEEEEAGSELIPGANRQQS